MANETLDTLWVLFCGIVALLMHAGFAMLETGLRSLDLSELSQLGGSCRARNASNLLLKNVMNLCAARFLLLLSLSK